MPSAPSLSRISRLGFVNAYLVGEDDGLTLVDTMIGGSQKAILAAAADIGQPIVRIVLTHAHGDHIGSLDALHQELPDAEVIISARDARLLKKDKTPEAGEPGEQDGAKYRGGYSGAATEPTRVVNGGDRIGSLEVVASPGHTPGHIALLDTRDRTLIAGDAYSTFGGAAVPAKSYWRFPLVYSATWHRPTALASARELRKLEPSRLATGHGKIVESPLAAMDAAIARAEG